MNINKIIIKPANIYNSRLANNSKKENKDINNKSYSYNPMAYKDYNISFGKRLFRTPANFYAQDFNRNNMPETMKEYLFENYEDRQHIPPAQMMGIVFNDLNNAKTLEEVKEMFQNEPLFSNLHSMSDKKYREGILAELTLMKEPDKSLFKNGNDDLGLYILKKIYIEGKTLKEINKDFKNDVSNVYKGLSEIKHRDLQNFGIKYPNLPFWNSFYITRKDFPYIRINKKDAIFHTSEKIKKEASISDINKGNFKNKKKPKYNIKDHEIKKLSDAVMDDFGDSEKTKRNLKQRFKADDPKLTFIRQYMSEIMFVSLDRVHASEEMMNFFSNYDDIDQSARIRMKKYWDSTPEMKALQGLIMSDTIKYFFLTYGADGNNEEFKDLIEYARSIKPTREQERIKHDMIQKEYDELFKDFNADSQLSKKQISDEQKLDLSEKIKESVDNTSSEYRHVYSIGGKQIRLKESMENLLSKYFISTYEDYLPKNYILKYLKFIQDNPQSDNKFLFSLIFHGSENNLPKEIMDKMYNSDEVADKVYDISIKFIKKHILETRAAQQALVSTLTTASNEYIPSSKIKRLYYMFPFQYAISPEIEKLKGKFSKTELSKYYSIYKQPLNKNESIQITAKLISNLKNYDVTKSDISKNPELKQEADKMHAMALFFSAPKNPGQSVLKDMLPLRLMDYYGGAARALLDKNLPEDIKTALTEDIILSFYTCMPNLYSDIALSNEYIYNQLK